MWYLNIEDTVLSCDTTDEVVYYLMGYGDPHYPVPATIYNAQYDLEYVWLLYERNKAILELRQLRNDTIN